LRGCDTGTTSQWHAAARFGRVLRQLAVDVLAQVHRAAPRSHLAPFLESGLVLTLLGGLVGGRLTRSRVAAALGGAAGWSLATAVSLTLFRGGYRYGSLAGLRQCALTTPVVLSGDGVTNLVLFAPTAFLAVLAIARPGRVIAGVAVLSLLVEGTQAVTSVGVCDSSDALLNTLGALVAALVAAVARWALAAPRRSSVSGSDLCPRSS
jgi:hypothetical protein